MFGTTQRTTRRIRWAGIVSGAAGLVVGGALLAPQAFGGAGAAIRGSDVAPSLNAPQIAETSSGTAPGSLTDDPRDAAAEVSSERGIVLVGSGTLDRREVFIEIYGNDVYGSQATVVVTPSGGPNLAATVEVSADDLLDGDIAIDTALDRLTRGGPVPARTDAAIAGTWAPGGPATEIDETFEDAGYLFHITGTNTPVAVDIVVTVDGQAVSIQWYDTFTFDLTVTATPL